MMTTISNFDAQVFVPVETNLRRYGLGINRRQLLSVTYFREMRDGYYYPFDRCVKRCKLHTPASNNLQCKAQEIQAKEYEPIYRLVEQAELYLNLKPFVSNFELEVYMGKADGHMEINNILYLDEQQLPRKEKLIKRIHNPSNENYAIEAVPLSYRLPDEPTVVISTMQNSKRWAAPRPYVTTEKKNASVAEKVAKLEKISWLKDWIIQPRQRKNGKYDMYYYHRTLKLMCRSLVEVHNFHLHGTLPKRASRKLKKDNSSDMKSAVNVNKPAEPIPKMTTPHKRSFEYSFGVGTSTSSHHLPVEPITMMTTPKKRNFEYSFGVGTTSSHPTENATSPKKRTFEYSFGVGTSSHPTENGTSDDDDRTDTDRDDDDEEEEENDQAPPQSAEEFLKEAYNNLLMGNWDPKFVTTDFREINGDYEDANNDDEPPKSVEEFLRQSYSNLLNTSTTKSEASKGYKKRRVDKSNLKEIREGNCVATAAGKMFQGSTSAKAKGHALFEIPVLFKP